ncbi:hypothetical protein [Gilvimarinus chinensis]|uniref:hypothetical protein n=1 Tax=Gilvimarinus chinensis TaxID=396005 RepID=UPI00036CC655|nr:hypothetical protein [Gilvimarinus chinensis]
MGIVALEVKPYRGKFAIFACKSRLASGFKSADLAQQELQDNRSLYEFWAGSAGTSVENTPAKVVKV